MEDENLRRRTILSNLDTVLKLSLLELLQWSLTAPVLLRQHNITYQLYLSVDVFSL